MQAHWNEPKISEILTSPRRKLFDQIVKEYQAIMADLKNLPVQAIHNDVNDYNILKIRPPLTIQPNDVDMIIATLDSILQERF